MRSLKMFCISLIILLCMFTYKCSSIQARKICPICVLVSLRIKADRTAINIKNKSLINWVEYINEIIRNSCSPTLILKCLASMFLIAIDINILNTFLRLPTPQQVLYFLLLYVYPYNKHIIFTRFKSAIHNILSTETLSICYNIILRLYHIIFKYVISITLTDIITCSVCKTLYLYVSSVYTVMWHDIIMHSFMSKYLIIDSL